MHYGFAGIMMCSAQPRCLILLTLAISALDGLLLHTPRAATKHAHQDSSLVLQVHSLSVRAKGKLLLENTQLSVTAGRRYGLVGPNGKGKSTLLRLIARRQIPVPEGLDVLLVEQVCWCCHPMRS